VLDYGGQSLNENRFCFSEEGFSMASEQIVDDENNILVALQCQKASRGILDPTNVSLH
jgi:hypothetical protein